MSAVVETRRVRVVGEHPMKGREGTAKLRPHRNDWQGNPMYAVDFDDGAKWVIGADNLISLEEEDE